MIKLREIITITDDYEVAKAKATIAVKTVQWCHELGHLIHKVKEG